MRQLFTQEIIPQLRERSRDEAIQRLKQSLGLLEVGKRESIEVTPEEVETRVAEVMEQYADQEVDAQRMRSVVENELLTEKIVDWLLQHSSVELVPEGSLSSVAEISGELETPVDQGEEQSTSASTESI